MRAEVRLGFFAGWCQARSPGSRSDCLGSDGTGSAAVLRARRRTADSSRCTRAVCARAVRRHRRCARVVRRHRRCAC